jgi:hypothetical protein
LGVACIKSEFGKGLGSCGSTRAEERMKNVAVARNVVGAGPG